MESIFRGGIKRSSQSHDNTLDDSLCMCSQFTKETVSTLGMKLVVLMSIRIVNPACSNFWELSTSPIASWSSIIRKVGL